MLPRKTTEGSAAWLPCPGGAPYNALLAARRLGLPVSYLAALSTDMFGEQLHGLLAAEGVNLELVSRLDRPTTLAFVSRVPGQGEKYAFFKENAADRGLTTEAVQRALAAKRFDAVHMSLGAVTLEDKQMQEAFEELFKLAGQQKSLRTFDPNLRTNMIAGGAEAYRGLIERFLAQVDVVKLSDDDLEFLYGKDVDHADVAARWLGMGPRLVIITAGAEGSTTYYPTQGGAGAGDSPRTKRQKVATGQIKVAPPGTRPNTVDAEGAAAPVIDTVGAGDTFMGSFIGGMLADKSYEFCGKDAPLLQALWSAGWTEDAVAHLKNVVERAALCASINCSRAGCDPPSAAQVLNAGRKLGLGFAAGK